MHETDTLKRIYSKSCGDFMVERYLLDRATLFAVRDTKPENNVWSSTCYILKFDDYCVMIDPGFTRIDKARKITEQLEIGNCDIALTQGHYDHSCGLMIVEDGKVYVHKKDGEYVTGLSVNPEQNHELAKRLAITRAEPKLKYDFIKTQKQLEDLIRRTVFLEGPEGFTPGKVPIKFWNDGGHTPGHVIYYFGGVAFAGDVLVKGEDMRREWYIDFMFGKGSEGRDLRRTLEDCRKSLNTLVNDEAVRYVALGHGGILQMDEFRKIAKEAVR